MSLHMAATCIALYTSTLSAHHHCFTSSHATCSCDKTAIWLSALVSARSAAVAFLSTFSMVMIMMLLLLLIIIIIIILMVVMEVYTSYVGHPNSVFVCFDCRKSSGMARISRHGLSHWQGSETTTPKTCLGYPTSHGYPTSQLGGWPIARVSHTAASLPSVAAAVLLQRLHALLWLQQLS